MGWMRNTTVQSLLQSWAPPSRTKVAKSSDFMRTIRLVPRKRQLYNSTRNPLPLLRNANAPVNYDITRISAAPRSVILFCVLDHLCVKQGEGTFGKSQKRGGTRTLRHLYSSGCRVYVTRTVRKRERQQQILWTRNHRLTYRMFPYIEEN